MKQINHLLSWFQHKWLYNPRWVNYNVPHIGNTPNVRPRAAEKANCFGSAPLKKKMPKLSIYLHEPNCHNKW